MKKIALLFAVALIGFTACEKENEVRLNDTSIADVPIKVYNFENEQEAQVFYDSLLRQVRPELFEFADPHSELWSVDGKNGRKKSTKRGVGDAITVIGSTGRELIQTRATSFSNPNPPLVAGVIYLGNLYYYKYRVAIPTGYELVIPPESIMNELPNQGWNPGNSRTRGYQKSECIETKNGLDYYDLYTQIEVISHDIQGRLLFDPPLYLPGYLSIDNITWKYTYQEKVDWGKNAK